MKKMSKHIVLSFAVSSLLFSQAYALPQGGKFTHGSIGSISSSNGTMNITGNKGAGTSGNNFVIQWGGGFNIGQNESVKFNGNQQNYLNIAYQKDASKIDGKLDGGTNNIFLVNPMGVLIGTNGSIIANKFVASTIALSDDNVKTFLEKGVNFSPIFNPNKQGNIVNLGAINAQDIVLVGNRVEINKGDITSQNLNLTGNKVYVDAGVVKNTKNILAKAEQEAIIQQSITSFEKDGALLDNPDRKFSFDDGSKVKRWTKYGSITDATEWNNFANFWNSDKSSFRSSFDHFRLIDDVDFKGMQTNIVGDDINNAFTKSFDGSGYALKNVNINSSNQYVGIFGVVQNSYIRNLNIQGLKIASTGYDAYVGGIVGQNIANSYTGFENVTVNDLAINTAANTKVGGIIGWGNGSGENTINFTNVAINDISIVAKDGSYVGGIGGLIDGGNFNNVVVNDIEKLITSGNDSKTGGLAGKVGNSKINNAYLFYKNGAILSAGNYKTQAGKVIGDPGISVNNTFGNIYVYHNLENGYIDEGQNFFKSVQYNNETTGKKDFDNAIRKQFSNIKHLDNNSYAFADSFAKVTDIKEVDYQDYDPKLLQRILDDIFNGKYVYKLEDNKWYVDLDSGKLVEWSKFISDDQAYIENPIYQSIKFLDQFKTSQMADEYIVSWNKQKPNDSNYQSYAKLYNTYKNKFNTSNIDSKYKEYQEALKEYQDIVNKINDLLGGSNPYENRLQGLIDSIKNYNEASKALDSQINEFQKVANALQAQIDYYNKNFSQLDDETAYNQFIKLQAQIKDFTTKQSQLQAQQNALLAQFNKINSEKGALDQIYNDLLKGQANGNTDKAKLDQLKQALVELKLDSLVNDPNHSLSSIGKDADGKAFAGSYVFSGALKDPSKMPSFNKPTDNTYAQNDTSIPSVGGLEYEPDKPDIDDKPVNPDKPDKPDIDDKPTLPDQKPDEGGDNPNQGGDNTVDIDNDTSNVIYADNQGRDEEEDEEENKLGLDETQAQEKGVLCVVSDDFRTMNICAIK
ncbi:TPA: filamentous hemagglutinin N-terminal domain-containing protein [Campylobacter jejuni]